MAMQTKVSLLLTSATRWRQSSLKNRAIHIVVTRLGSEATFGKRQESTVIACASDGWRGPFCITLRSCPDLRRPTTGLAQPTRTGV